MIIVSFLLDGLLSTYIDNFIPLFTLTSLVIASYYYKEDDLIKYSLLIGICYDITYTNTLILNGILFYLLILLVLRLNKKYQQKLITLILINTVIITLYLVITYIILIIFKYLSFDLLYLLLAILKGTITNTIYLLILYFILKHRKKIPA